MKFKIGLVACLLTIASYGQMEFPALSPKGKIDQKVGNTNVQVEYERPSARNRQIFGELVPWNAVWRTGAGRCTTISFDKDVTIGGQPVKAGKYALFTIPTPKEWVVILNSDTEQFGSFSYNSENDVLRFTVPSEQSRRYYETFTLDIDLVSNNGKINLSWANTSISFDLETSTNDELMEYIDKRLLTKKEKDENLYANAAEQLCFLNTRLNDAIQLADIAIEKNNKNGYAKKVKMDIYEKLHQYEKALEVVNSVVINKENKWEVQFWEDQKTRLNSKINK